MMIKYVIPKIEFTSKVFSAGETHIQIIDAPEEPWQPFNITANIHSANDLMELLMLMKAIEDYYPKHLIYFSLVLPYLPYSRQDRVCAKGQAFGLELFRDLLHQFNIADVFTYDVHSEVAGKLFSHFYSESMATTIKDTKLHKLISNSTLVCPDKGATKRVAEVKKLANCPMITCEKVRDPTTGWITNMEVLDENPNYPRTAVIVDDICDGGMTFILIAKELRRLGYKRIILYVTHGIFSKGLEVFDNLIDEVYTTDSFPQTDKVNII